YANHLATLQAAEALGYTEKDHPVLAIIKEQIDHLDPVNIGYSGQVKEFREENYYGEIGDPKHRHISQLVYGTGREKFVFYDDEAGYDKRQRKNNSSDDRYQPFVDIKLYFLWHIKSSICYKREGKCFLLRKIYKLYYIITTNRRFVNAYARYAKTYRAYLGLKCA
ncbi:MAG: hypothetical protein IJB92_08755, partial [Clostridia bacterium]|nr:hypothetical protein [Clostridia bacterium]